MFTDDADMMKTKSRRRTVLSMIHARRSAGGQRMY